MDDAALATSIAREAGAFLLELRARGGTKDDADRGANELILDRLRAARPDDAILTEESKDTHDPAVRVGHERIWIIDPLDGTREFGEPGRTDWAVHVALVVGGVPQVCAVALPAQDGVVFSTADPPALPPAPAEPLRIVVSRTRPPDFTEALAAQLGATLVPMGSAGAKTIAVVQGEAGAYVHDGGQYEWDSAAPVGVAAAAGCHCSRLDGTPLRYNQRDLLLPDLVVCRPELAERLLAGIAAVRSR